MKGLSPNKICAGSEIKIVVLLEMQIINFRLCIIIRIFCPFTLQEATSRLFVRKTEYSLQILITVITITQLEVRFCCVLMIINEHMPVYTALNIQREL